MKRRFPSWALAACLCMTPPLAAAQRALISAESGKVSPLVESVVNSFQLLLRDSSVIVLSTDGDEQREMAKLAAFLKSRNVTEEGPQIMDSVRKQFRRDTTGFARPVWLSEHSAKGNACVLAVRQNEAGTHSALLSRKIGDTLISDQRLKRVDSEIAQASIVAHEMYHCYEYLRVSMTAFWTEALQSRLTYAMHRSESAADAFAALYVLQNYDAVNTVRMLMEFRRIGMLNSDVEHNTSQTVEHVLATSNNRMLSRMAPGRLVLLAEDIRNEKVMDEDTFVALKKSSIEVTGAYINLLTERPGVNVPHEKAQLLGEKLALMDDAPQNVRMTAYVMNEISGSLHKIGAKAATSSKYFRPLMERYARRPIPM
ncbi:MAG: hypothetical protein ACLGHA_02925 [Gammaproteobacteria bacterium]